MQADRWQQIEKIFYSAVEYEPSQRSPFLDGACAGDLALRKEVESLLEAHDQAAGKSFLNSSAVDLSKKPIDD